METIGVGWQMFAVNDCLWQTGAFHLVLFLVPFKLEKGNLMATPGLVDAHHEFR